MKSASDQSPESLLIDSNNAKLKAMDQNFAIIEFSPKGIILDANDIFLKTAGYRLEQIKGEHHSVFCDEETHSSKNYRDFWLDLEAGISQVGEFKRFTKSGEVVWLSASYTPVKNSEGKVEKVIKFAQNCTAEKIRTLEFEGKISAISKSQAIIEFDLEGNILFANENFLSALKYRAEDVIGKHHRIFCDKDYVQSKEYAQFWTDLRGGTFKVGEYKRFDSFGKEVWINATYNPILDSNRKPYKIVKFAIDVTQDKVKNAEFEGKLKAISKSQAVIEFDLSGNIISANENFLNALGYSLDEVAGKHHRIFCEEKYVQSESYKSFWAELNNGAYHSGEFKRIAKNREEVWIKATYNPILDVEGKPFKIIKFASVVTDEKMKNAEFEGKLEAISKSQAVIEFNLEGIILNANDNFLNAMGYSSDEVVGKHHRIFCEDSYSQSKEYVDFWKTLNEGKFQAAEYKRFGKNGKEVWINASYNPILDADGKPFKVVKYATDVTLSKKRASLISSAVQELSGTIRAISQNIENTKSASGEAKHHAESGEKVINDSLERIEKVSKVLDIAFNSLDELKDTADEANTIIKVVNDISYKTELLALNASIEAARAGAAGKGFAVVAEEVGRLSEKTQSAIGQVERILSSIQKNVESVSKDLTTGNASSQEAVLSVSEAQQVISNMLKKIESVDNEVGDIAKSISEQAQAVDDIANNSNEKREVALKIAS